MFNVSHIDLYKKSRAAQVTLVMFNKIGVFICDYGNALVSFVNVPLSPVTDLFWDWHSIAGRSQ